MATQILSRSTIVIYMYHAAVLNFQLEEKFRTQYSSTYSCLRLTE